MNYKIEPQHPRKLTNFETPKPWRFGWRDDDFFGFQFGVIFRFHGWFSGGVDKRLFKLMVLVNVNVCHVIWVYFESFWVDTHAKTYGIYQQQQPFVGKTTQTAASTAPHETIRTFHLDTVRLNHRLIDIEMKQERYLARSWKNLDTPLKIITWNIILEVWKIIFLSKWVMAVGSILIFQGVNPAPVKYSPKN